MPACLYRNLATVVKNAGLSLLLTGLLVLAGCAGFPGGGKPGDIDPARHTMTTPAGPSASPVPVEATASPLPAVEPPAARIDQSARRLILEKQLENLDWCLSLKPGPLPEGLDQMLFDQIFGFLGLKGIPGLGKAVPPKNASLDFEFEAGLETRKSAVHAYAKTRVICRVYDSRRLILGEFVSPGTWTMSDLDAYDAAYRSLLQAGAEVLALAGPAVREALAGLWAKGISYHLDAPEVLDPGILMALLARVYRDPRVIEASADREGRRGHLAFFGSLEELQALVHAAAVELPALSDPVISAGLKVGYD